MGKKIAVKEKTDVLEIILNLEFKKKGLSPFSGRRPANAGSQNLFVEKEGARVTRVPLVSKFCS